MNIANAVGFEDATDFADLKVRLELFRLSLIDQLRKEPTVFHANPTEDVEAVEGAKSGDIAVWKDSGGVDHFYVFG